MKKFYLKQVVILGLSILTVTVSGCASIFGKSTYPITLNTDPSGADISITNKKGVEIYKGSTPATVKLKSSSGYFARAEYQIKIHKNGYSEKVIPVNFKLNGWYFGNLLIGGLIGMLIIDPATGAMYKIENDAFNEKLEATATTAEPTLNIRDYNSLPESIKTSLIKLN
jgi:hypothetical protein